MPHARNSKKNARPSSLCCNLLSRSAAVQGNCLTRAVVRAAVLSTTLLFAACGDTPRLAELDDDAVILAFGDSLTYGTGAKGHQSYPAVLENLTGITVVNAGLPGEESDAGLERLPKVVADEVPDLVILCHGGNDFLRKRSRENTEKNLRSMIDYLRAQDIPVVLLGVPEFGLLLSTADVYHLIADELDVPLEDDIIPDLLGQNKYKSDHLHPNADGYRLMAKAIRDLLVDSGALVTAE